MNHLTPELLHRLRTIVGDAYVLYEVQDMEKYAVDFTSPEKYFPAVVLLPSNTVQVAEIVKVCHECRLPVTVRGGGTGVSGGALAAAGNLMISLERLNHIVDIDVIDRTVTAEAGVITAVLQEAVRKHGLCFPQNISSAASCFIGGNVAVSSGSPKSLKYGPTRNFVLNLEVVLANGEVMWTGKNITKNATGYNLTQLFAGSEGSLGIITQVVLQLVEQQAEVLAMAPFDDIGQLFNCVQQVFIAGYTPSSIEFIDQTGFHVTAAYIGNGFNCGPATAGLLWIELEGKDPELLLEEMSGLCELMAGFTRHDPLIARTPGEINRLWALRTRLGEAVIDHTAFRDLDFVVPRSRISRMYNAVRAATGAAGLTYTAFGHIGNGNFHLNIFHEPDADDRTEAAIRQILAAAVELDGTISGEHGIGQVQLPYLELAISPGHAALMKGIKQLFDPAGIFRHTPVHS